MTAILIPLIVLGVLLLLLVTFVVLGRVRGGRYLRPIVTWLAKVPLIGRGIKKASMAQLERENPELASAVRKFEAFGTPKNILALPNAYLDGAAHLVQEFFWGSFPSFMLRGFA